MIKYFRVGKIIKPHGILGEAKVFPTSSEKNRYDRLFEVYFVNDENNENDLSNEKTYKVQNVKYLNDAVILKIQGIDSIEDIEKYIGYSIYIKRDEAIALCTNEYFIADLIGMNVKSVDGSFKGNVIDVIQSTMTACLVVSTSKKEVLIPIAVDYIDKIDVNNNVIDIKLIEGILDI